MSGGRSKLVSGNQQEGQGGGSQVGITGKGWELNLKREAGAR